MGGYRIARGGGSVTFSDSFNRTLGPLGKNWNAILIDYAAPFSSPAGLFRADIAAITGGGAGFKATYCGTPNPAYDFAVAWIPYATQSALYNVKQQFAQVKFVSATALISGGIGVFCNPELLGGIGAMNAELYYLYLGGTNGVIYRGNGTGWLSLLDTGVAVTANSVWRFSADASNPNQVVVSATKNGVLAGSYIDTAGGRVNRGAPGIIVDSGNQTGILELSDFACGVGL